MQYKKFFVFVLVLAIVAVFVAIKTGTDGRRATARINSRLFDENGGDTVVLNIKSKLFRDV